MYKRQDLHRDASGDDNTEDFVKVDGKECARLMFVVGKGTRKSDEGKPKPDWKKNIKLARALTKQLDTYSERLTRNVRLKTGRYNQNVSNKCLLVEVCLLYTSDMCWAALRRTPAANPNRPQKI